jgi:nitrite reductase/ring-hydroxylating ferredoxin subunit
VTRETTPRFENRWFPLLRMEEVVPRHVVQAQLLGQEIAVWRDDTGYVNAWENRCPHRGVRLSIGLNTGEELRCQYHGWRYSSRTGQCSLVPANPDRTPAKAMRAIGFACREKTGFVWVNLGDAEPRAPLPALIGESFTTLRSVHVDAPLREVNAFFQKHGTAGGGAARDTAEIPVFSQGSAAESINALLLLQPMNAAQTVIHGVVRQILDGAERLALLRAHDRNLNELRDEIERTTARAHAV